MTETSVHDPRNGCSRWSETGVHDRPKHAPMLLRMFEKRLRGYRGIGYARGEAPLGYAERGDEILVEFDEDVLRWLKEMDDFA